MSLMIKDAVVLTMDGARAIHDPGAVYVAGNRIIDVGA